MSWTKLLLRAKARALAIHVGISALIFLPILYLIWFRWFPPPLFFTDGGWQGIRIMLFVDVVIGPTLTFLIFNPAKSRRELGFDFSFIAIVQAAALAYGFVSVESKRPLVLAFHEGKFLAVAKDRFRDQAIEPSEWSLLGERPPYWVYVREPATPDEQAGVLAYLFTAEAGPAELFFLYSPYFGHWEEVRKAALDKAGLLDRDPDLGPHYAALASEAGVPEEEVRFVPLDGYYRRAFVAFDQEGRYLGTLYSRPIDRRKAVSS